ncbi:MAG: hypothetical protein WD669_07160 [Pirellulales bacterium]
MSGRNAPSRRSAPTSWVSRIRLRPQIWAALLLLSILGVCGQILWQQHAATVARNPEYQLTANDVHITAPPPWVRSDIKSEVLRDAALIGNLSLLEDWDTLVGRVRQAFEFHPWVASVTRITRALPNSLQIELEYRRPVAAVESSGQGGVALLPIDTGAVRLPEADLTDDERRYLPRIANVAGRPLVGHTWDDPRVVGGAKLAAALAEVWHSLRLVVIHPSSHPLVQGDARFYSFEIVTSGGTRIVWGAAPGEEQSAGESTPAAKRQRLLDYAVATGRLDAIDGPASVDVRRELIVTPRTARREAAEKR